MIAYSSSPKLGYKVDPLSLRIYTAVTKKLGQVRYDADESRAHMYVVENKYHKKLGISIYKWNPNLKQGGQNGTRMTEEFSSRAKSKIRYAIDQTQRELSAVSKGRNQGVMLTLTYSDNQTDEVQAKSDLRKFRMSLQKKYKKVKYVWIMERQNRGAIHFHIYLSFNLREKWRKRWWPHGFANVRVLKDSAVGYMSKYLSKCDDSFKGNRYAISQSIHKDIRYVSTATYKVCEHRASELIDDYTNYMYIDSQYLEKPRTFLRSGLESKASNIFSKFDEHDLKDFRVVLSQALRLARPKNHTYTEHVSTNGVFQGVSPSPLILTMSLFLLHSHFQKFPSKRPKFMRPTYPL